MEAIKTIAKRTKAGKYKIDLPIISESEAINVMVIIEGEKKIKKNNLLKFAGKLESKTDWIAYQKKIRNEWK